MAERFARLPTAAKLLLILTAVLLPIGIALAWVGNTGIQRADAALDGRSEDVARASAASVESLIARNALALRVAANGALGFGPDGACERTQRSLTIAPAVAQSFELESADGKPICSVGTPGGMDELEIVPPSDIRVRIAPDASAVALRVGVVNGMATAIIGVRELRTAALETGRRVRLARPPGRRRRASPDRPTSRTESRSTDDRMAAQ